jgi:hypothetical protein
MALFVEAVAAGEEQRLLGRLGTNGVDSGRWREVSHASSSRTTAWLGETAQRDWLGGHRPPPRKREPVDGVRVGGESQWSGLALILPAGLDPKPPNHTPWAQG